MSVSISQPRKLLADTVRDRILDQILDGSMPLGSKLPAEPELCEQHGVSRATIREAVRGLVEEGYLSRAHGSGTFVKFRPRVRHSLERNLSYTELISQAGFEVACRLLEVKTDKPSPDEAERLRINTSESVLRLERVHAADGRPVIHSTAVIPHRIVEDVDQDRLSGSLFALFGELGYPVAHGEAILIPVLSGPRHSEVLGIDEGKPLLQITQVDYSTVGDVVMFSKEWHVPGVFELTLVRRPR